MSEARPAAPIRVRLSLFADLRRFLPKGHSGALETDVPPGATVRDLLDRVGVPADGEITIGVNGEQGSLETRLRDGDEIVLFSPMEGG